MLCSKLHCPKGFNLIPSSYRTSEPPAVRPACPKRSKVTRKQRPARSVNRGKKRENSLGAASNYKIPGPELAWVVCRTSSSSLLISSPELNDTNVSEPYIRALLGTASHFCGLPSTRRFLPKSSSPPDTPSTPLPCQTREYREFLLDNLLVQIHVIIVMIRWTGLALWEFDFPLHGEHTPAMPDTLIL